MSPFSRPVSLCICSEEVTLLIDLATIGGEILRSKRPKIDSHNQVSDGFLFKMYFYKQRRKGIFVAFVVWSVVINNLLICQFREADSRFSRRRSEPHPP